jgi:FAD synthase
VHVFDFNETIYDLTVEVFIQNFVRPEQKFNSKNA